MAKDYLGRQNHEDARVGAQVAEAEAKTEDGRGTPEFGREEAKRASS
jgi:hypothetical protein